MTDEVAQARRLAVELLLADPEALGHDALEADLRILREQMRDRALGTVARQRLGER